MDLNPLAEYVYEIIEEKGFHSIEHTQVETLTFRQLLHLVTEWGEMFYHYDTMRIANYKQLLSLDSSLTKALLIHSQYTISLCSQNLFRILLPASNLILSPGPCLIAVPTSSVWSSLWRSAAYLRTPSSPV